MFASQVEHEMTGLLSDWFLARARQNPE